MIQGHGDDRYRFQRDIQADFSSNVYSHVDLEPLKAHLRARLDVIGRYPEPEPYTLEKALAVRLGIDPAAVCVTAGATEAIYLIAHAFTGSRSTILQPTFSEYADACRLFHHSIASGLSRGATGTLFCCEPSQKRNTGCSTRPTHAARERSGGWYPAQRPFFGSETDTRAAERAMRCRVKPGMTEDVEPGMTMVWMCNPNNPTGTVIPKEQLVQAIEDNLETIFVIDQSYGFFTREPLLSAAETVQYPNVLQLHSMTKRYAMPGLRLGYVTGHPALIEKIRVVRMPWSVNALAIEAGLFLTAHPDTAPIDLTTLLAETQRLRDHLNAIPGLTAEPTQTHFFLCRLAQGRAVDLKQELAEEYGILIRDASNFEGLDEGCFRIATQTPEENDRLVEAIRNILKVNE